MEKMKLLIVDDEYLIRNLIRMRVDWEAAGVEIIGEAGSAQEALALVDELAPDIIFADICMPYMDGIEFSRIVVEKYPSIKIVVITGHDEFEYARRSVKLGIADFILKPIKAHELLAVTNRLRLKIDEERGHEREIEQMRQKLTESMPILREKFLNELIFGFAPQRNVFDEMAYFGVELGEGHKGFRVALAEFSHPAPNRTSEDDLLLGMKCARKAEVFFADCKHTILFSDNRRRLVILCADTGINLTEYCDQLKVNIVNSYKCYADFGVSSAHDGISGIQLCYMEARNALDYRTIAGKNQVICYEETMLPCDAAYRTDFEKMEKLRFYISVGAVQQTCMIVDDIFSEIHYSGPDTVLSFRIAALDVLSICGHIALEHKMPSLREIDAQEIIAADNLPEIKEQLLSAASAAASFVYKKNRSQAGNLISRVKKYMQVHMHEPDLGLAGVSAEFFVSTGHLGRLMKQEAGQTFVEHLTGLRIEHAKKLLIETDLKGYQVGEQVGILDAHYFSILFKKCTGMSVNEFRNISRISE